MKNKHNILVSLIVGLTTGLFGTFFLFSFKFYGRFIIKSEYNFIAPTIGGIILSIIWYFIGDGNKNFGSAVVLEEIKAIDVQIINIKDTILKFIGTTVSICTGFLMGKVGFFIHLGGAIGSNIAYSITKKDTEIKLIISAGVAGALASITGSVLFGIIFVLELYYIKKMSFNKVVYPLIISSVSAYGIVHLLFGKVNILNLNILNNMPFYEAIFYSLFVGMLAAFVGFVMKMYVPKLKMIHNKKMPFFSPFIGGIIISFIGYFYPDYFKIFILDFNQNINFVPFLIFLFVGFSISVLFGAIGGEFTIMLLMGALIGAIIKPVSAVVLIGVIACLSSFYGIGFSFLVLFIKYGVGEMIVPYAIASVIGILLNDVLSRFVYNKAK